MSKITFPEVLYDEYRDRYVQRPPQHKYFRQIATAAAVSVNTSATAITIPMDCDCLINFLGWRNQAAGGQFQNWFSMSITPPNPADGNLILPLQGTGIATAGISYTAGNLAEGISLEAGSIFWFAGFFNAGVSNNQLEINGMYCLYPRMKF